jgi:uncharacterized protein (DUF2342 family)
VGSLSAWAVAGFDTGLPPDQTGPLTVIVPNIESIQIPGVDQREVHLWVVANEVAFRSVCEVPWIHDHLAQLVADYAAAAQIDPTKLSGLIIGGTDPSAIEKAIEDAGGLDGLIGGEEAEVPRAELEAFLGAIAGCGRLLARRAVGEMSPSFDEITAVRDRERDEVTAAPTIGIGPVPSEAIRLGDEFNQEVERRYGDDALETLWSDPSRMPTAHELRDPTAWAARVLLDGWS